MYFNNVPFMIIEGLRAKRAYIEFWPIFIFRFLLVFVEQKVSRGKLSLLAYVISEERSANRPKQLRNGAFHVKTSQSAKN